MKLRELLVGIDVISATADLDMEVSGICCDTRKLQPGDLFVAVVGYVTDGNRFIPKAKELGASVVVSAQPCNEDIPSVLVRSDRLALARLGTNFYGHPADSMQIIGVTGTNGKTTVTCWLKHILEVATGKKVGLIGTMENYIGKEVIPTERTTPESLDLQRLFARMRDAGCAYVVMEVSSQGISLNRTDGVEFEVGGFTNLTEDHLDFHKTMEAYGEVKASMFHHCKKAVVNADDEWVDMMVGACSGNVLTTSYGKKADLRAENVDYHAAGIRYTAVYGDQKAEVEVSTPGRFSVYNSLTALGLAMQLGVSLEDGAKALKTVKPLKGRVEVIPTPGKPYTMIIDYAHTPDGLENILSTLKPFCKGRLISIFGGAGDRDPMKRPIMGKIATDIADLVVLTSDSPRTEDPKKIIREVLVGMDKGNYVVVENRADAIRYAMDIGQKDDIIVMTGRGHENYLEMPGGKIYFEEREVIRQHLLEMEK